MTKTSLSEETENSNVNTDIVRSSDDLVAVAPMGAGIHGEIDQDDIKFPLLQIVSGMGKLSEVEDFKKGDLVLDGEHKLEQPCEITVVKLAKLFEENLPWGADEIPRTVSTKEEVYSLGGTLGWQSEGGERIPPTWKPMADCLICVKGDDNNYFPFDFSKKEKFAFARWKLRNTSYFAAATDIISAAGTYYRKGLSHGTFMLTTEKRAFKTGNTTYVPTVKKGDRNDEKFVEWLAEFV